MESGSRKDSIKTIAVVQCRMGSKRLPGKVMSDISGRPMLWYIVDRLRYSRLIDEVIVATSTREENLPIVRFCEDNGISSYAGKEEDLVDRFYQTARKHHAGVVVRITADCPLVDPGICDKVVGVFLESRGKYEYVSNCRPLSTYPHGLDVEVFSYGLLERLWKEIKDPFRREWFTTTIFENPQIYDQFCVRNDRDLSSIRLTVDYPEDLELVRYVFSKLYSEGSCFFIKDILRLFAEDPSVFAVNDKYKKDEAYVDELKKRGLA
ncbi:cytidylyltransferase domain-containing protein [Candidatus Omnitrophota bacterium]